MKNGPVKIKITERASDGTVSFVFTSFPDALRHRMIDIEAFGWRVYSVSHPDVTRRDEGSVTVQKLFLPGEDREKDHYPCQWPEEEELLHNVIAVTRARMAALILRMSGT